jgi:hypothetical protein
MNPCDERADIVERLDAYIEFAEKTHRFHDADFYECCRKEIIKLREKIDHLEEWAWEQGYLEGLNT